MPFFDKINLGNGTIRALRVRAVIVIILVVGATVGFFQGSILPDSYMQLVTMGVGWWMGNASTVDNSKPPVNNS